MENMRRCHNESMHLCHSAQKSDSPVDGYARKGRARNVWWEKVNMDRNCPDYIKEISAEESAAETVEWIKDVLQKKYRHTRPI